VNVFFEELTHLYILYAAALALKARTVVELGTGFGVATRVFSDACLLTGGTVYTIDKEDGQVPLAKSSLKNRKNVRFIKGDTVEAAGRWDKGGIDILYCDSDHSYQHVLGELRAWERHGPRVVFIHDTLTAGGEINEPYRAGLDYAGSRGKTFVNFRVPLGLGMVV